MTRYRFVVDVDAESEESAAEHLLLSADSVSIRVRPLLVTDTLSTTPKVRGLEILAERVSDGETIIRFWLDGEQVRPDAVELVDPGWGYTLVEWRIATADVQRMPYSQPFKDAVLALRQQAEASQFITRKDQV